MQEKYLSGFRQASLGLLALCVNLLPVGTIDPAIYAQTVLVTVPAVKSIEIKWRTSIQQREPHCAYFRVIDEEVRTLHAMGEWESLKMHDEMMNIQRK